MEELLIKFSDFFNREPYLKVIVASLLTILSIYVLKQILLFNLNKKNIEKTEKVIVNKKIHIYTRYIIILAVFLLWFSQLQGVFVSLVAVAAAIVLALKEVIMCLTGGVFIKSANLFKLGDRIDIGETRGFVIERGLFSTKVLEIGPEKHSQQTTGNIVSFPNCLVFGNVLRNESYFKGYSIKSYSFQIEEREKISEMEKFIVQIGNEICFKYLDEAKKSISQFCEIEGIAIPSIEPRTKLLIEEDNSLKIMLKMPVKNSEIGDVEQKLNRKYIEYLIK